MNADHMIDETTPRINAAERAQRHARMDEARRAGAVDWADWWKRAAEDPALAAPTARRFEIYGEHADGDMPSPSGTPGRCARPGSPRHARCGAPLRHAAARPQVGPAAGRTR